MGTVHTVRRLDGQLCNSLRRSWTMSREARWQLWTHAVTHPIACRRQCHQSGTVVPEMPHTSQGKACFTGRLYENSASQVERNTEYDCVGPPWHYNCQFGGQSDEWTFL